MEGVDLRDPYFLKWKGKFMLYMVGYYSELADTGWTPIKRYSHNAPHRLNIWKIREYKGVLYGIGNCGNEWPMLLTSTDGINWEVKDEYKLGGDASEADLCFVKDNVYICIRVDKPAGSMSLWGVGTYPFEKIKWSVMDVSVAAPELMAFSKNKILLAGREYDYHNQEGKDVRYLSIIVLDRNGDVLNKIRIDEGNRDDKGYASFCHIGGKTYLSYYTGYKQTKIRMVELNLRKF